MKQRSQDPEFQKKLAEATRNALSKPVLQIDKATGCCIGKWKCAYDAQRETGIKQQNISECCNGKRKTAGGYRWQFAS